MTTTLRTMSLGGILDRAIQILRANFALFAGLALISGLAQLAFRLASVHPKTDAGLSGAHIALVLASYFASFVFWAADIFLGTVVSAAICFAASRVHLGEEATIRGAFGAFAFKGGRLVWLGLLQGIFAGWPLIIAIPVVVAMTSFGASIYLQIPIWILGSIPCIVLYTRYALAFPATAIENLSAHTAIERSISLGEGNRWKICWGFLLPGGVALALASSSTWLIEQSKTGNPFLAGNPIVVAGLDGIVALLLGLVFTPLCHIVLTLLYYDQRIRREGFDIERMMESAGLNAPATLPVDGSPATPAAEEKLPA